MNSFAILKGVLLATLLVLVSMAEGARLDANFHSPVITYPTWPERVRVLPDDSYFLYRDFDRLNGSNLGPLIKFTPSGTYDPTFRMRGEYFDVNATAFLPDGKLLVAANQLDKRGFSSALLRLNGDGSVDPTFAAGISANNVIYAIVRLTDGKILVGGVFTTFNNEDRSYLVRLNADGSTDPSFAAVSLGPSPNPDVFTGIRAIILQPDNKILIGGSFSKVNESTRNQVARLNSDGTLDLAFASYGFTNSSSTHAPPVRALACDSDGSVLVGGRFRGGASLSPLLRLDGSDGSVLQYFSGQSGLSPSISALKLLSNRHILAVGDRVYKFTPNGDAIPGYQASRDAQGFINGQASDIDVQSDGKFLVVGNLNMNDGFVRYAANGTPESLSLGPFQREQNLERIAVRSGGEIWVSNTVSTLIDQTSWEGTARLNMSGNPVFVPSDSANGFALDASDRIVLFYTDFFSGQPTLYSRYEADDTWDIDFRRAPNQYFTDMTVMPDGGYVVTQPLSERAIEDSRVVLRLRPDGSLDNDFHFGVNFPTEVRNSRGVLFVGDTHVLLVYPDGRFLARYLDANGNYRLKRFQANGAVDSTFLSGTVPALTKLGSLDSSTISAPGTPLTDALLLTDGRLIVVGMFDHYNGVGAPGIVRLEPDGAIDSTFTPRAGAQWNSTPVDTTHIPRVDSIKLLADGRLLITGDFEAYDGHPLPGIARLLGDGTRDPSFYPPVALQPLRSNFNSYLDSFDTFPVSQLVAEPTGTFLLAGNFAAAQSGTIRSLVRLTSLTDPLSDSDGDGMPDDFEAQFFGNATSGDSVVDSDGDGKTNLEEYLSGTDPTDRSSAWRMAAPRRQGNDIVVSFRAMAGIKYRVEASTNLTDGYPLTLATVSPSPSDTTLEISDPGATTQAKKFYRVVVVPPDTNSQALRSSPRKR